MVPQQLVPFGPYDVSAMALLSSARALDPSGRPLTPQHVLLAALPDPSTGTLSPTDGTFGWLRPLAERPKQGALRHLLQQAVQSPASEAADELLRCALHWQHEAQRRGVRITDALVVWAVLDDVNAASQLFELTFPRQQVVSELEQRFLDTSSLHSAGGRHIAIEDYLEDVEPTEGYKYAGEFTTFATNLLAKLHRSHGSQFVVAYGERGSLLRAVRHTLADLLPQQAQPAQSAGDTSRLSHCGGATILSVD